MRSLIYFSVLLLCLFFSNSFQCLAQVAPPGLSIGANEVLFSKGVLDTELIGEIIAEKQDEIKREIAKRIILNNRIRTGPYITYSYAEKTLTTLLDHKEKGVLKKAMLENAAELAIVLGITEAYLNIKPGRTAKLERRFYQFANPSDIQTIVKYDQLVDFGRWDLIKLKVPLSVILQDVSRLDSKKEDEKKYVLKLESLGEEVKSGAFLSRITRIFQQKKLGSVNDTYLHHILLDLFLEVCRENKALQQLGFFQTDFDAIAFQEKSNYQKFLKWRRNPDRVYKPLESKVEAPKKWKKYQTYQQDSLYDVRYDRLALEISKIKSTASAIIDLNLKFANVIIKSPKDSISKKKPEDLLRKTYQQIFQLKYDNKQLNEKQKEVLIRASKLVYEGKRLSDQEYSEEEYNYLTIELEKVIPELLPLIPEVSGLKELVTYMDETISSVSINHFQKLLDGLCEINNGYKCPTTPRLGLAKVLQVLTNLNKASSYDQVAKLIIDVGDIFYSITDSRLLGDLADLQKYLVIKEDSNRVDVLVEDMILFLNDKYIKDISGSPQFYFTVGYNYLASPDMDDISFASEKIGIKFKLRDFQKSTLYGNNGRDGLFNDRSTYYFKKRKPLVNHLYFLVYGSGLLYQIQALKSENDVDGASFGAALGVNFFNGLDLNLGLTVVRINDERYAMFNAGFDIPIAEYLSRLRKKKKTN